MKSNIFPLYKGNIVLNRKGDQNTRLYFISLHLCKFPLLSMEELQVLWIENKSYHEQFKNIELIYFGKTTFLW